MTEYAHVATLPIGAPSGSDRLVSTRIKGVSVALPCYEWCVTDHHVEDHAFIEDFNHSGREVAVTLAHGSATEQILSAHVFAYPHTSESDARVAVENDGEYVELTATQAEAFADDLITAASRIRLMARVIDGGA